jgi:septum formation protein
VTCEPAHVDEAELKDAMRADGAKVDVIAEALAELKATRVSRRHPGALVIGADSMIECGDVQFDKPPDPAHAVAQLLALAGRTHRLLSAAVVMRDGVRIWHQVDAARLTMRGFDRGYAERYVATIGNAALSSVGAYQLEGIGAQLFTRVEGDFFTVLGLPLLPLLDFLRGHGVVAR